MCGEKLICDSIMYSILMSTKSLVTKFQRSCDGLLERVIKGTDEAVIVRHKTRKQRNSRDVNRELKSIHMIGALFKGAIVRKEWGMYSTILSNCNTDE
tara:strand:- start:3571 stop:3864 length:294 start_codon:yes stop_codon:yes gene_type:complete